MNKEIEKQYIEYIEKYNIEDTLDKKAEFFMESGDLETAIEIYKSMDRDVINISSHILRLNPKQITLEEFSSKIQEIINYFYKDYSKILGEDTKHWPEDLIKKFSGYYLD